LISAQLGPFAVRRTTKVLHVAGFGVPVAQASDVRKSNDVWV
jgi:hypothetical protein